MIVNGVTLPDIPESWLTEYPYCWIRLYNGTYNLHVAKYPWYFADGKMCIPVASTNICYKPTDEGASWVQVSTYDDTGLWPIEDGVQWANHDIMNGSPTATDIYFPSSEPKDEPEEPEAEYAERYSILGSILVGTARQIMRLTDSTQKVKPEEFEAKMEGINIQLQELTVTATEKVQTITPPSGIYGFSKIIVEAVEDSGGTGGGTGGEGGEGGESYGSAENVTFGNEYEETEKVFMDYSTGGYNVPEMPAMPAGAYQALCENSSNDNIYYAVLSPIQMAVTGNGYYIFPAEMDTELTVYEIDLAGSKAWTLILQRTVETVYDGFYKFDYNCVWTNADIMVFASDSIYKKASPPATQRTETTIVVTPVEREETYTIGGDTLNSLVGIAQQVTGSKEPLTPEEATEILDQYSKDNWEGGSY